MYTFDMPAFNDFLLQKLQEFERTKGRRITQEEFADFLGVNRISVSYWLSGRNKPSPESAKILADKLGVETYDVLELPRPDPFVEYASSASSRLLDSQKHKIRERIAKYISENEKESSTS